MGSWEELEFYSMFVRFRSFIRSFVRLFIRVSSQRRVECRAEKV